MLVNKSLIILIIFIGLCAIVNINETKKQHQNKINKLKLADVKENFRCRLTRRKRIKKVHQNISLTTNQTNHSSAIGITDESYQSTSSFLLTQITTPSIAFHIQSNSTHQINQSSSDYSYQLEQSCNKGNLSYPNGTYIQSKSFNCCFCSMFKI